MSMNQHSNRRLFLTTLGAGAAFVAGCSDLQDNAPDEVDDVGSGDDDEDESAEDEDEEEETEDEDEDLDVTPPAIDHGELLDDFSDPDEWAMVGGEFGGDADEALVGEQALQIQGDDGNIGVFRAFPDGLDIEGQDLSLAVKIEAPRPVDVVVEILAPFESDMVVSRRHVVEQYEGWQRMDVGYVEDRGEPDLSAVEEIRIFIEGEEDEEARFWIDDLRMTESASQGYAMLVFDDNVESQFTNGFPLFEERDMQGVLSVIPPSINQEGRLDMDQLREMRDAGWDITAHSERNDALTEMEPEEAQAALEEDQEYIEGRGFEEGSRAHFVPFHYTNEEVSEIIRDIYEFNSSFGANTNAMPPTDPIHASRVAMHDFEGFAQLIDMAARYNQFAIGLAHGVGDNEYDDLDGDPDLDDITEDELEDVLEYIEESDVELVTVSDVLDNDSF
jgi:hypothetical protein